METLTRQVTLETDECWSCGGVYGLTKRFRDQARIHGKTWNCPYCKASTWFGKGEMHELREQLRNEQCKLSAERARHDQTKACLRATKGAKTKLHRKIANGLCPCCGHYFKDLHRHMESEHPRFRKED